MRLAIVPGSFDPMTVGHLELVKKALSEYDRVVVAVMNNAQKSYCFSPRERVAIAEATVADIHGAEVLYDDGMLIDLYDRLGACAVCKGWRNEVDLAYEKEMAGWNRARNPRFTTELMQIDRRYAAVSSTEVRRRLASGEGIDDLVHPRALPLIEQKRG